MRSPTPNKQLATGTILTRGDVLGGYQVVERHGFSTSDINPLGFAMVAALYGAEEVSSGLPVVLKVFKREYSPEEPFAKRYIREGKRFASFVHPNVASVYDAGLDRGRLYLATQVVDGDTLLDRMRAGGLSAEGTIALLAPLAEALDAARRVGLVHGDVTPGAIRIDSRGVHLAAFNVVKPSPWNILGVRLEDINYASPEQLRGLRLTGSTDVYSLTAVLYNCLTGEVPFPMEPVAAVAQAHFEAPAPTPTLESFTPACSALDGVIARGMAKDPLDRLNRLRRSSRRPPRRSQSFPLSRFGALQRSCGLA